MLCGVGCNATIIGNNLSLQVLGSIKASNHPRNVVTKQNLPTIMSPKINTKLDDLHMLSSLRCKPLLELKQGKTPHETTLVNCQEHNV